MVAGGGLMMMQVQTSINLNSSSFSCKFRTKLLTKELKGRLGHMQPLLTRFRPVYFRSFKLAIYNRPAARAMSFFTFLA